MLTAWEPFFHESLSQQKLRSVYFELLIKGLPECLWTA